MFHGKNVRWCSARGQSCSLQIFVKSKRVTRTRSISCDVDPRPIPNCRLLTSLRQLVTQNGCAWFLIML